MPSSLQAIKRNKTSIFLVNSIIFTNLETPIFQKEEKKQKWDGEIPEERKRGKSWRDQRRRFRWRKGKNRISPLFPERPDWHSRVSGSTSRTSPSHCPTRHAPSNLLNGNTEGKARKIQVRFTLSQTEDFFILGFPRKEPKSQNYRKKKQRKRKSFTVLISSLTMTSRGTSRQGTGYKRFD